MILKKLSLLSFILVAICFMTSCSTNDDDQIISVNADFVASITEENNQVIVTLNNTSINATNYEWSLEGGSPESSTEENVTVTYTSNGTYTITLKAINGDETDTKSETIIVDSLNSTEETIIGSGDIVTETFDLNNFTGVNVRGVMEVNIIEDSNFEVIATAYENLIEHLNFSVENNILILDIGEGNFENLNIVVDIKLPSLIYVEHESTEAINVNSAFSEDNFEIKGNSSGTININEDLTITDLLKVTDEGANLINLKGSSDRQEITVLGSGSVLGYFESNISTVVSEGSGDVETRVTSTLDVSISGSGDVYYKGNPTISSTLTGSGEIIDAN